MKASDYDGRGNDPPYETASEAMSLDTRHRDDGGNYIADHDVHPTTVWFANGRRVSIDHTEVKDEITGGDAFLQVDRFLHPAFAAMKKTPIDIPTYEQRIYEGLLCTKRLPSEICLALAQFVSYVSEQPEVDQEKLEAVEKFFLSDAEYAERWL